MGKGRFDKKQAVRFSLVPGPIKDGKPSVLFKPVQAQRTKLSKKQRKSIITQLSDYDEITINGKIVNQNEIPSFVLDQIRGRKDLVFNQMHEQQEQVGDLYEVQDVREVEDEEYEEYEDIEDDYEEKLCKVQEGRYEDQNDEDWEDDEDQDDDEDVEIIEEEIEQKQEEVKKYVHKAEDFPVLEELQDVEIDGITYKLTKAQAKLIDTVIPDNYEQLDFGGLDFKKYNEDGLLISEKEKYEKYYLKEEDNVVIVDSYNYVPLKPIDTVDNDYKPSQINGNPQLKEIQEALNYNGQEEVYEEMEDDFFAKMIEMELQDNKVKTKAGQKKKQAEKTQVVEVKKPKETKPEVKKIEPEQLVKEKATDKELDEQLEKALFNFQHNIQEQKNEALEEDEEDDDQTGERNFSMNFTDLEKREEYIGRDGELDWRNLTKKQKRQYMKTKVIRQYYDELRQRQIEDKMKGIKNVTPDQLHLKTLVKHLTYEEDHVLRKALEEDLKKQVDMDAQEEDYSSYSSEDDIVSFHQKTSIIASNLSVIQEPKKKKPKKENDENKEETPSEMQRIKVVPEQRNRNQTKQERKERKEKLRALKKEKKEQKKQFAEQFNKIKKDFKKKQNTTNPLNKVSYVKIH